MERPRVVRGTGRLFPTLAAELIEARVALTVAQSIGLAMRATRNAAGASQRAYAEMRGWSKTHQHRLEAAAANLQLGRILEALEGTGFELALLATDAEGAAPSTGRRLKPEDWEDSELIAVDAARRRFPANREVRRTSTGPTWWWWQHSTDARARTPDWTTERAVLVSTAGSMVASMDPTTAAPQADRPRFPDGYGIPESAEGQLAWIDVEPRLVQSKHYWISSVRPDGTPHSVPRWGVWLDGRFWYDGAPTTRHTRNVEVNPAVTLTLESGTEVIIIEGDSVATHAAADGLGARLSEAFGKYADSGYSPGPDSWSGEDGGGLRVITARRAMAWFDFPKDCTRFRF